LNSTIWYFYRIRKRRGNVSVLIIIIVANNVGNILGRFDMMAEGSSALRAEVSSIFLEKAWKIEETSACRVGK